MHEFSSFIRVALIERGYELFFELILCLKAQSVIYLTFTTVEFDLQMENRRVLTVSNGLKV